MITSLSRSPEVEVEVAPGNTSADLALICRVRDRLCALQVADVVETMRPQPIDPLPSMPRFVCGVSLIRGSATPVVDVGALLALNDEPRHTRFVVVRVGERRVALAVEGVIGVRGLPAASLEELPPLLRSADDEAIGSVGVLDARFLVVLRAARMVPEAVWEAMTSREAPA
jgi:purine-binding chemotaxis protein CheW